MGTNTGITNQEFNELERDGSGSIEELWSVFNKLSEKQVARLTDYDRERRTRFGRELKSLLEEVKVLKRLRMCGQ